MLKLVKASFKDCSLHDRKVFKHSSCIMPISVGQKVHEGEHFSATIDLINRSFNGCTILVDDVIQRYSLKLFFPKLNDDQLYEKSLKLGDDWINRNKTVYEKLLIPYNVMRWEDWLKHEWYDKQYKLICNLYDTNSNFKGSLESNAKIYLDRVLSRDLEPGSFNYEYGVQLCIDYLKEECAVMTLWATYGFHFEVYPTGRNLAMQATYKYIILPQNENLVKSVAIRFKRN